MPFCRYITTTHSAEWVVFVDVVRHITNAMHILDINSIESKCGHNVRRYEEIPHYREVVTLGSSVNVDSMWEDVKRFL